MEARAPSDELRREATIEPGSLAGEVRGEHTTSTLTVPIELRN
jgi:hypothetical protein